MSENKEKRGIYNVSFNEKLATPIKSELELIEDAVISYIHDYTFYYVKGYHSERKDKGVSAEHIKLHLESGADGEININELLDLGKNIRAYLKEFKEAFIDDKRAKIYEWQDKKGTRFRVVIDKISKKYLENLEKKYQERGLQLPLTSLDEIIITFYSDRNLNERMLFKNPKVSLFYEAKELNKELELLLKQRNKAKEINSLLKQMKAKNIKLSKANQNILNKANQLSR